MYEWINLNDLKGFYRNKEKIPRIDWICVYFVIFFASFSLSLSILHSGMKNEDEIANDNCQVRYAPERDEIRFPILNISMWKRSRPNQKSFIFHGIPAHHHRILCFIIGYMQSLVLFINCTLHIIQFLCADRITWLMLSVGRICALCALEQRMQFFFIMMWRCISTWNNLLDFSLNEK